MASRFEIAYRAGYNAGAAGKPLNVPEDLRGFKMSYEMGHRDGQKGEWGGRKESQNDD